MIDVSRSCTIAAPPASRMARRPSAPSRPMPVSTTPTMSGAKVRTTERKSGSADGRTPQIGGEPSSEIVTPRSPRTTRMWTPPGAR
jgi:hypothetical protein